VTNTSFNTMANMPPDLAQVATQLESMAFTVRTLATATHSNLNGAVQLNLRDIRTRLTELGTRSAIPNNSEGLSDMKERIESIKMEVDEMHEVVVRVYTVV
jgi:hypothetical protein